MTIARPLALALMLAAPASAAAAEDAVAVTDMPCGAALEILRGEVPGTAFEQAVLMGYVIGLLDMATLVAHGRGETLRAKPYAAAVDRIEARCENMRFLSFDATAAGALLP